MTGLLSCSILFILPVGEISSLSYFCPELNEEGEYGPYDLSDEDGNNNIDNNINNNINNNNNNNNNFNNNNDINNNNNNNIKDNNAGRVIYFV